MDSFSLPCPADPTRSFDGYLRLTFDDLSKLEFPQKLAWEDDELKHELLLSDVPAARAGYCEWATDHSPAASIGWAWFAMNDGRKFLAPGAVNSNIMLVTLKRYDLGPRRTQELLRAWLVGKNWRPAAIACTP